MAESDDVLLVEFAVYFPFDSVTPGAVRKSAAVQSSYCHWKGVAQYYDVIVDGELNEGAAWVYEEPYEEAQALSGRIAFWNGVDVDQRPPGEAMMDPLGPKGERTGYEALCWLLVRTEETALSATQIEEQIGLSGAALASTFAHRHVKPFADRYQWSLVDGGLKKD